MPRARKPAASHQRRKKIATPQARNTKADSSPRARTQLGIRVGRALRRAALDARKLARMHNTPIYVEENGKIVAIRP